MLNILVIGGTQMLGRNLTEHLINKKIYKIYIANRGITNPFLFKNECEHIKIDRDVKESCSILQNYNFDFIYDFSCYNVNQFQNTFHFLNYRKYIYISTISVFDKDINSNNDINNQYHLYRKNKQLCEKFIKDNNIPCLIIRPCAIYGDNDYTNRFYKKDGKFYWHTNNQEASNGALDVNKLSEFLLKYINFSEDQNNEINVCDIIN